MTERGASTVGGPPPRGPLSRKVVDLAKNLLSSLFMAIRTAKIHDPSNAAFETAVQTVFRASEALFSATGGFSIQFVEDTIFLNGSRLRLETSAFSTMRTLRRLMEAQGLGGLELMHPPRVQAIQKLVLGFAPGANLSAEGPELGHEIRMLGVQRLQDERPDIKVDRRVFAVQCYGKLVLAVREQLDRIAAARACDWGQGSAPPRLRIVRVVQDLVELGGDRADFLLRLSTNGQGATPVELHGANTCLLSIVMGHALGLPRQDLVDLAVAALFHHIGAAVDMQGNFTWHPGVAHASLARLLAESGAGHSSYLRALVVGEQPMRAPVSAAVRAHPYARLTKVAAAYDRLVTGFGEGERLHPIGALARLYNADSGDIDRDMVDLLINVLRAFPVGCRVVLDDGATAIVTNQLGGARWDRPIVQIEGPAPRIVDLSVRDGGRFAGRVRGTARWAGQDPSLDGPLDERAVPIEQAASSLDALLEGEDVIPDDLPPLDEAEPYDEALEPGLAFGGSLAEADPDLLSALDPDATLEGPARDLMPDVADLALDAGDLAVPDTQPALQSLPDLEPLGPLSPPDEGGATIVAPSAFEVSATPQPALTTPDAPPPLTTPPPATQRWSELVPDEFGDFEQDPAFDEARLEGLEQLPAHHSDTFDDDDEDDTRSE